MPNLNEFYSKIKGRTKVKDYESEATKVFQDKVEKELTSAFKKMSEYSDVTVVWETDDPRITSKGISAGYAIDIDDGGIILAIYGKATLSDSGRYSTMMKCYRNAEVGSAHDFISYVNVTDTDPDKFVDKLVDKVMEVYKKASEED